MKLDRLHAFSPPLQSLQRNFIIPALKQQTSTCSHKHPLDPQPHPLTRSAATNTHQTCSHKHPPAATNTHLRPQTPTKHRPAATNTHLQPQTPTKHLPAATNTHLQPQTTTAATNIHQICSHKHPPAATNTHLKLHPPTCSHKHPPEAADTHLQPQTSTCSHKHLQQPQTPTRSHKHPTAATNNYSSRKQLQPPQTTI